MAQVLTGTQIVEWAQACNTATDFFKQLQHEAGKIGDEELYELAYRCEADREKIVDRALSLRRTLDQVIERCEGPQMIRYYGLNNLGEVQGRGTDIDITIALYHRSHGALQAEIGKRVAAEKVKHLQTIYTKLLGSQQRVLVTLKLNGDQTIPQLSKAARLSREEVSHALNVMQNLKLVDTIGRFYRLTNDGQTAVSQ